MKHRRKTSYFHCIKYICLFCLTVNIKTFAENGINEDSLYLTENYTKSEYQIPMRDGIRLFTAVYSPKDSTVKYPILLLRTPYDVAPYGNKMDYSCAKKGLSPAFLREKFIFVLQDVRGRFMSEGVFQHMTPFLENKRSY